MILTCPKCTTRFLLPANLLEPDGRDVKCSKCGESWYQHPDTDELLEKLESALEVDEIPKSVRPVPEGSGMPAIRKEDEDEERSHAVAIGFASATAVFVIILAILIFCREPLVLKWPKMTAMYETIGVEVITPGDGVEFDRVMATMDKTGEVSIEGLLVNLKAREQTLPMIKATVKDSHGAEVAQWLIEPPAYMIDKEATLPFKAHYPNVPEEADSLHLHFVLDAEMTAPKKAEHAEDHVSDHAEETDKQNDHHDSGGHH